MVSLSLDPQKMSDEEIAIADNVYELIKGADYGGSRRILRLLDAKLTVNYTVRGEVSR